MNAAPMAGMAIYQNELYVLEGSMNSGGDKTLSGGRRSRPGSLAMRHGTRNPFDHAAFGFDIDTDGVVYFPGHIE